MQIFKRIILSMLIVGSAISVAFGMGDIWKAVEKNDVDRIGQLRAYVNSVTSLGETPLHFAASWGRTECVKKLIELGANVNAVTDTTNSFACKGTTPLHRAACHGYAECIEILCKAGAGVGEIDIFGKTALHYAAEKECGTTNEKEYAECIKRLLEFGVDVKVIDRFNKTGLHLAVKAGFVEGIQILVNHYIKNGIEIPADLRIKIDQMTW